MLWGACQPYMFGSLCQLFKKNASLTHRPWKVFRFYAGNAKQLVGLLTDFITKCLGAADGFCIEVW